MIADLRLCSAFILFYFTYLQTFQPKLQQRISNILIRGTNNICDWLIQILGYRIFCPGYCNLKKLYVHGKKLKHVFSAIFMLSIYVCCNIFYFFCFRYSTLILTIFIYIQHYCIHWVQFCLQQISTQDITLYNKETPRNGREF